MADDTILAPVETPPQEPAAAPESAPQVQPEAKAPEAPAAPEAAPEAAPPVEEKDWRADLAGDDDKLAKFLGKFPSLKAAAAAHKAANDKLLQRAGSKLPDNPSEEELAAYRKEQGIPDKPEGYLDKLPSGLVVGDDDRPAVDAFLAKMHAVNAGKPQVDAALSAYYEIVAEQEAAQAEKIATAKEEGVVALRDEWGGDYKRNLNAVTALIATLPGELQRVFAGERDDKGNILAIGVDADGNPLANNPHVIRWLANLSLEQNPLNTVVPGQGSNQASAVADEIAKWEGMMGDKQSEYWKGPNADKNQARLRDLYDAREKIKDR